jgi:hypothetical protein
MRKSIFYYTIAYIAWACSAIWAFFSVFYYDFFKEFRHSTGSLFPIIDFGFIFIGISLARKGNKAKNLELGLHIDYSEPPTKKQKTIHIITSVIFMLAAVILLIINITK